MSLRDFFTDDQVNLIPEYQEKWRRVYLNAQLIDQTKAASAVHQAYRVMGKPEPKVIFCSNPRAALDQLQIYIPQVNNPPLPIQISADNARDSSFLSWVNGAWIIFKSFGQGLKSRSSTVLKLQRDLENLQLTSLEKYVSAILPKNLTSQQIIEYSRLAEPKRNLLEQEQEDSPLNLSSMFERQTPWFPGKGLLSIFVLKKTIASLIIMNVKLMDESGTFDNIMEIYNSTSAAELDFLSENPPIETWSLMNSCIWIDFAISELNFPYDHEKWSALKELAEQCGWILAMSEFCIVCDRPASND